MADDLRFIRAQDPQLSLWQSVVAETAHPDLGGEGSPVAAAVTSDHPLVTAANDHVAAVLAGEQPPEPASADADPAATRAYLSRIAFEHGQALAEGDEVRAAALADEVRKYSDHDPGFLTCATTYAQYYAAWGGVFAYYDWTKQGGGNINFGVIPWHLPNDAKVAIIGDWGTGLSDAKALLREIVAEHAPTAIIHLGDIYYSATPTECATNFADILTSVFDEVLGPGNRIPVFTLAGNHDYYSLGHGYYQMFQSLNVKFPVASQAASYFCLRTQDGGWQFLGMDTGYFDSNPANQFNPNYAGPWLMPSEVKWLQHKMDTFKGATVLLSHHQLFSANAKLNGSASPYADLPYLNPFLHRVFAPYFANDVAGWLWGHEHNFVLYADSQFGLSKGRLVGNSAYEEDVSSDPYKVNYPQVRYLDPTQYRVSSQDGYFNHGYAIMDLAGRATPDGPIGISYFEYPSWGSTMPPSPEERLIYKEQFVRPQAAPPTPVTYGSLLSLYADEGLFVGPMYQMTQYYPTLTTDSPGVRVSLSGGSGNVTHGSTVQIKTSESSVGSYNVLGAWSTPTLYYYTPGYGQQNWTIQKRDPSDPVVHFGDEVTFVNQSYSGQMLQPYWSRVYGSIYLTTQGGDPYYWTLQA